MNTTQYIRQRLSEGVSRNKIRQELKSKFGLSFASANDFIISLEDKPQDFIVHATPAIRQQIRERDGRICQYCGTSDAANFIIEHVVPLLRGGPSRPYNLVIACDSCNIRKGSKVWVPRNIEQLAALNSEWARKIETMATEDTLASQIISEEAAAWRQDDKEPRMKSISAQDAQNRRTFRVLLSKHASTDEVWRGDDGSYLVGDAYAPTSADDQMTYALAGTVQEFLDDMPEDHAV
jgi:hypothetical protein